MGTVVLAQDIPFDLNTPSPSEENTNSSWGQAPETIESAPSQKEVNTELEAMPMATPVQAPTLKPKKLIPAELSGLGRLAPFSDVAVISKRYLPKTKRFEFHPNLGLILNDAFFNNFSFGARLGYYFTEHYSVEALGIFLSTTEREVTKELGGERNISTSSFATAKNYLGLDFKWSPVYGKLGWFDTKIIPFDLYFSGGGGITETNQKTRPFTIHLGIGQIFAINKWMAFRWDVSWFTYSTQYTYEQTVGTTTTTQTASGSFNNIYGTIGLSFFFPEATYR